MLRIARGAAGDDDVVCALSLPRVLELELPLHRTRLRVGIFVYDAGCLSRGEKLRL